MEIRTVKIPYADKDIIVEIRLNWVCPKCGKKRGEVTSAMYCNKETGKNGQVCHTWMNACGDIDMYPEVIEEAKNNGLNDSEILH